MAHLQPIRFEDTARYRQLTDEITFYSSTDGSMYRADAWKREALKRELADEAWAFANPGKTGCWRIFSGGVDASYHLNSPRFESEEDARAYVAVTPGCDYRGITVEYVVTRAAVEAHNRVVLAPEAQVTFGGQVEAHRADLMVA